MEPSSFNFFKHFLFVTDILFIYVLHSLDRNNTIEVSKCLHIFYLSNNDVTDLKAKRQNVFTVVKCEWKGMVHKSTGEV